MADKIIKGKVHKEPPQYPDRWWMEYLSSSGSYKRVTKGHCGRFSPGVQKAQESVVDVVFVWSANGKADKVRLPDEDESVFDVTQSKTEKQSHSTWGEEKYMGHPKEITRAFHNPYNFVPAVPPEQSGPLGQHRPVGHYKYHAGRWNGRIKIEIETVTPLLVPDAAKEEELDNGHKVFPVRTDAEGRPLLAPTSVKGMLRSAYEAITNSRLGVFMGHDEPLAHRMPAKDGLAMIPARVTEDGNHLELLMGTVSGAPRPQPKNKPLFAAWLPRYTIDKNNKKGKIAFWAAQYQNKQLPEHKDKVWCWIALMEKWTYNKKENTWKKSFSYWKVIDISTSKENLINKSEADEKYPKSTKSHRHPLCKTVIMIRGWVCITNQNINRKHDERIFFYHSGNPPKVTFTEDLRRYWELLIKDYQELHKEEIGKRQKNGHACDEFLGPDPGQTAFSRHVCDKKAIKLKRGDLLYARVNEAGEITGLFPVMISRELEEKAPKELLRPSLLPAANINELSPADRVFGWVSQDGKGAWRGSLRIGPVRCETENAIEDFDEDSLPLAILSMPKPQQARFYVACDDCGGAQEDGITRKAAGYTDKKGLRGRKIYPHHALASNGEAYWNHEEAKMEAEELKKDPEKIQVNGKFVYREYIRRKGEKTEKNGTVKKINNRDDQNRSVEGWVKPGTTFTTWLEVENLNEAELGALLWLLGLSDGHYLRLGGGKPLGFGSVQVRIKGLELVSGEGRKKQFESLMPVTLAEDECVTDKGKAEERFMAAYREALEKAYGGRFETIPFIEAFLKAAKGFDDKPTHYPRANARPDPDGKNYEWFVRNEKDVRSEKERRKIVEWKLALPNLMDEKGLPYIPDDEEQGGGCGGHRQGRRGHGGRGGRRH